MRKILFPVLIVFALLLSACGTAKPATTAAAATTAPTGAAAAPAATTAPDAPTPTPAPFTDSQTPCKPFNILNEILPASLVKIPDVSATDWVTGPANAPVTFILYSDLQCPACGQADPIFNAVVKAFPNDVRLVFRHWPLVSIHDKALQAAKAAEAAGKQGQDKFFAMTELLFTNQAEWSAKSAANFTAWLNGKSTSLGLDAAKFAVDWNDPAIAKKVDADLAASNKLLGEELSQAYKMNFGTPTLIINGSPYLAGHSVELISSVVNLIINKSTTVQQCPATIIDLNKDYFATITTSKGDIVIDLLEKSAPISVNSFVFLAQSGWFKDNAFFVSEGYAISGDKTNSTVGGPGYAFKDEIDPAYSFDKEGVVGLKSFGPGVNGSQFFILKAPLTELNGRYTIFGLVTQGMNVVKALALFDNNKGLEGADKILSVTITAK